jgi:hypothetical protein
MINRRITGELRMTLEDNFMIKPLSRSDRRAPLKNLPHLQQINRVSELRDPGQSGSE